jgi:7,8-dihydropterin-6-yl-methyl-4-(beta-D-ribofuranosyl)aminobenzene 5'-phosphate synthase
MRITTLVENHPGEGLQGEHGLSFYIEHAGHVYLSDVGKTGLFMANAHKLGVDLAAVDALVITHHHYDHGGGLPEFFAVNDKATVFLRRSPEVDYVVDDPTLPRYVGLDKDVLAEHADRIRYVDGNAEVMPGLTLLTELPAVYPKPSGDARLKMERVGEAAVPDTFEHELATVLEGQDEVVLLTGCAHNGVLNMIEATRQALPDKPIKAVIGGFHLMAETQPTVFGVGKMLSEMDIPEIYTGHCTGEMQTDVLAEVLGERFHRLHTGLVMAF